MPHNVIVVRVVTRVDEKQPAANSYPVLLRVVAAQDLAVVEPPLANRLKVDAIRAARNVSRPVGSQRQEIAAIKMNK